MPSCWFDSVAEMKKCLKAFSPNQLMIGRGRNTEKALAQTSPVSLRGDDHLDDHLVETFTPDIVDEVICAGDEKSDGVVGIFEEGGVVDIRIHKQIEVVSVTPMDDFDCITRGKASTAASILNDSILNDSILNDLCDGDGGFCEIPL